jgi:hypothetical protein
VCVCVCAFGGLRLVGVDRGWVYRDREHARRCVFEKGDADVYTHISITHSSLHTHRHRHLDRQTCLDVVPAEEGQHPLHRRPQLGVCVACLVCILYIMCVCLW